MSYLKVTSFGTLGSKIPGDSPRTEETLLKEEVSQGILIPENLIKETHLKKVSEEKLEEKTPGVTENLPHAFRKSRSLYPKEVEYLKEIFGSSLRYDKIRITRDHWFSKGSTRVTGNIINFTSFYGGEPVFEDTSEEHLTQAGLDLLGHEAMHVWQYQNGGWAYAGDALAKQAAGYYSTGSRNTAYDWQTADDWEIPWNEWGPEQQAQAIDDWNLAKRNRKGTSAAAVHGGEELVLQLQPYVEKMRKGEGATQFSVPGTVVSCLVAGGIGYLIRSNSGLAVGVVIGIVVNLPWNRWRLKKA